MGCGNQYISVRAIAARFAHIDPSDVAGWEIMDTTSNPTVSCNCNIAGEKINERGSQTQGYRDRR